MSIIEFGGVCEIVWKLETKDVYITIAHIENVRMPDGYHIGSLADDTGTLKTNIPLSDVTWTRREALRRYNNDIGKDVRVIYYKNTETARLFSHQMVVGALSITYIFLYITMKVIRRRIAKKDTKAGKKVFC